MPEMGTPPNYLDEFEGTPQAKAITTTSTTENQSVGDYTPEAGKDFIITAIIIQVYYTTLSGTAALLGSLDIQWDGSTIFGPYQASNTSSGALFGFTIPIPTGLRLQGDGSKKLEARCSPAGVTSTRWIVDFIGYLRTR